MLSRQGQFYGSVSQPILSIEKKDKKENKDVTGSKKKVAATHFSQERIFGILWVAQLTCFFCAETKLRSTPVLSHFIMVSE